jgi:hypothetical protein
MEGTVMNLWLLKLTTSFGASYWMARLFPTDRPLHGDRIAWMDGYVLRVEGVQFTADRDYPTVNVVMYCEVTEGWLLKQGWRKTKEEALECVWLHP